VNPSSIEQIYFNLNYRVRDTTLWKCHFDQTKHDDLH
jgi:hypothetical protein